MLYLQYRTRDAAPKCISERTSYLRVRLAFHRYPQLIQAVFNRHWFGPPLRITGASTWPWVDHSVSGLLPATCRPERLGFPSAPGSSLNLAADSNSPVHYAKGTPSHIPVSGHSALTVCRRYGFRFCFTPLPGYFSPFPHGTSPLSVAKSI